jgi:hypothetical protein
MSTHPHVPADDEATSIIDLVEDCREVSGVLAPYVPAEVVLRLPLTRPAHTLEIDAVVAAGVGERWGDY